MNMEALLFLDNFIGMVHMLVEKGKLGMEISASSQVRALAMAMTIEGSKHEG